MTASVAVQCNKGKDTKELAKEIRDTKSLTKDRKDDKDQVKERKDTKELAKEIKDTKSVVKDARDTKTIVKERKDLKDRAEVKSFDLPFPQASAGAEFELSQIVAELEARVSALEAGSPGGGGNFGGANAEPFIGSELRPDLAGGTDFSVRGDLHKRMAAGDRDAKIAYDTLPPA